MHSEETPSRLLDLLIEAVAREVQVSVQYMMQHGVGAGHATTGHGPPPPDHRSKFVASHAMIWLPGWTLKKIAIAEMQHAEAIMERIVLLGGEPKEGVNAVTIGRSAREMLEDDREKERQAIELYRQIIEVATSAGDGGTAALFRKILSDEEAHHRVFSGLLNGS